MVCVVDDAFSTRFSGISTASTVNSGVQSSLAGFSAATETMSNCTCFLVFFCSPLHVCISADGDTGVRARTGLKSSVVNDVGFFSMDLISAEIGVIPVVNECDRLAVAIADTPATPVTGLHRRRGGRTGDWSSAVAGAASEADPSSYHTEVRFLLLVTLLPSNSRTYTVSIHKNISISYVNEESNRNITKNNVK